ncbi:hypothetical protein KJ765_06070 [Candidatus Micrarchaeota archaeon]|nr:hypothetical protein [Candidatus Micrarchaeota archaeon]
MPEQLQLKWKGIRWPKKASWGTFDVALENPRGEVRAKYTIPLPSVEEGRIRFLDREASWGHIQSFPPRQGHGRALMSRMRRVFEQLAHEHSATVEHLPTGSRKIFMRMADYPIRGPKEYYPRVHPLTNTERFIVQQLREHLRKQLDKAA